MTHATVEVHLFSFCLQRVVTYRSSILIVSQEMILEEIKAFCGTDPSPPPSTRTWGPWPWCMYSIDALSFLLKTCSRVFFEFYLDFFRRKILSLFLDFSHTKVSPIFSRECSRLFFFRISRELFPGFTVCFFLFFVAKQAVRHRRVRVHKSLP